MIMARHGRTHWRILTDIDGYCWCNKCDGLASTSCASWVHPRIHFDMNGFSLVLSWCVFALLEGVCRSFQTSFLWKRWSPFVVSSRACLWKVQSLLPQNQLPCWGEPGLLFKSVHLLWASSAQAALLAMVHAKTGSLYTCALRSVGLHCLSLWPFNCCLLMFIVRCCVHRLACLHFEDLSLFTACHATFLCSVTLCRQGWQQSLIHFLKLLRPPQIAEMCCLVCSGCIGRYGQWA